MQRWYKKIIANHFVEWQGHGEKSVKNGFARAVEVAKLDLTDGNVTPHTLRHTAATWLMQLGADPSEAAGYLGMSGKVLIDTYCHHHPDYMKEASARSLARRRPPSVWSAPRRQSRPSALAAFEQSRRENYRSAGQTVCQSPLCPDSDQIPQRSGMTRWAKSRHRQREGTHISAAAQPAALDGERHAGALF